MYLNLIHRLARSILEESSPISLRSSHDSIHEGFILISYLTVYKSYNLHIVFQIKLSFKSSFKFKQ